MSTILQGLYALVDIEVLAFSERTILNYFGTVYVVWMLVTGLTATFVQEVLPARSQCTKRYACHDFISTELPTGWIAGPSTWI